ncbi:MAG: sugar phosphate isomerase/epimerase [Gemmatimonadota bacterium]|nr:sugar phosphate isomerase/epimerase [Gemmatimonadota bacterium]
MGDKIEIPEVNRRTFLLQLAAVGAGTSLLSSCAGMMSHGGSSASSADMIGLQLYTVRDLLDKDFEGTIEKVAAIGYRNMEFAGYYNRTPEQVRALLDRLNLVSTSSHIGAQLMRQDAALQIRTAKTIGQDYITIPSYSFARDGGIDAWKKGAAEFNQWGRMCRDAGLKLGYHNHNMEFGAVAGGPTGFDVLMRETDPSLVDFEMDLYWTVFADRDPLELFAKYPGRFAMWHVKDLIITNGQKGMAPVGKGTINFREYFAHRDQAGLKHFFVEHDTAAQYPGGSLASIKVSYDNLKAIVG